MNGGILESSVVVKIGGSMMESDDDLREICLALSELKKQGLKLILVHGGGKDINRHLAWLNEEPAFRDGLRVTTVAGMRVVEMTLSGLVNKKLVGYLNAHGADAVGVSGVDGTLLTCEPIHPELGRVGRVATVKTRLLETLAAGGHLPVVSPISVDAAQEHYNVNADDAAGALARAVNASKLVFISDVEGVLDREKNRIERIGAGEIENLIAEGVASGGMIPKLLSCREALDQGVGEVHICAWSGSEAFSDQLRGIKNHGTIISLR